MAVSYASVCVLLLLSLSGLLAAKRDERRGEDRFQDLELGEPTKMFEGPGGKLEAWRGKVFEDANVAACRTTLRRRGLWLPSYVDSPALHLVTRGSGRVGIISPYGDHKTQSTTFKVEKGDVVAAPEGVAVWWYNDANEELEIFGSADLSNSPGISSVRAFHLVGGKEEQQRRREEQEQKGFGAVLHGFSTRTLARAWDMDERTVEEILKSQQETGIIQVKNGITFPEESSEESSANSFAANFIYRFARAHPEIRVQNGGELRELNSDKLSVLKYMNLGMECMHLEKGAMVAPNYFHNAHQVLYVSEGSGKVEVVSNNGRKALQTDLKQGQLVVIPEFYPSTKIASDNDRFHYISVVTSHRRSISYLTGRNSVYQAIPTNVLAGSFNIDEKRASRIQSAREDEAVILPREERGPRMYSIA